MQLAQLGALLAVLSACAASSSYERSLRAFLDEPEQRRGERLAALLDMSREQPVLPGVRLAAVHHAQRLGAIGAAGIDAAALLAAEVGAFPSSGRFVAAYRELAPLPPVRLPDRTSPEGVVLVVLSDRTRQRRVAADFLATIERPLWDRGWYVVPVEITGDVLAELGDVATLASGVPDRAGLERLHGSGIDACLLVDVRDFWLHEALVVEVARFDVDYLMLSTGTGAERWRRPALGHYERREPLHPFADDDDPFFYPSSLGPAYDDPIDLVRALNRGILRTVPPP
jgi:hypothetical protein